MRRYSGGLLNEKLSTIDWDIEFDDVQSQWNYIESKLIVIIDEIVPLTDFHSNMIIEKPDRIVKNKINKRNRLNTPRMAKFVY